MKSKIELTDSMEDLLFKMSEGNPGASPASAVYTDGRNEQIRHGDACSKCPGVVVWEEAEEEVGHDLKCNECGEIYKSV